MYLYIYLLIYFWLPWYYVTIREYSIDRVPDYTPNKGNSGHKLPYEVCTYLICSSLLADRIETTEGSRQNRDDRRERAGKRENCSIAEIGTEIAEVNPLSNGFNKSSNCVCAQQMCVFLRAVLIP
jgi:hypothetical protein